MTCMCMSIDKIFNEVEIIGAYQEINLIEKFNGTGTQTQFTLTESPEIVEVLVSDVLQIGGVEGSTAGYDYTVDKSNKQINFVDTSIPASGTDNVVVNYSTRRPASVVRDNEESKTALGRTVQNVFTYTDIQSVDDAESRGDKLLEVKTVKNEDVNLLRF